MYMLYKNKDGDIVVSKPHIATFNGKHNASKTKMLLVLYQRSIRGLPGLTARGIVLESGLNHNYVRVKLSKLCEWGYLSRRAVDGGKCGPVYRYSIAKRGEHFLLDIVPDEKLKEYIHEIEVYKENKLAEVRQQVINSQEGV